MAKLKDGFFGRLSGKIGPVIISSWKGIPYIRSRPAGNTSNSPGQKNQRAKFKLVRAFVNDIKPVVNAGFKWNTGKMTEMNSATSYIMKRAVKGSYPELQIDFPAVLVTRGELSSPGDARAEVTAGGEIRFSWSYDPERLSGRADDKGLVLAYFPERELAVCETKEGPERKDEVFTLEIPKSLSGSPAETYLAFVSADGREASDSVYLGRVVVG